MIFIITKLWWNELLLVHLLKMQSLQKQSFCPHHGENCPTYLRLPTRIGSTDYIISMQCPIINQAVFGEFVHLVMGGFFFIIHFLMQLEIGKFTVTDPNKTWRTQTCMSSFCVVNGRHAKAGLSFYISTSSACAWVRHQGTAQGARIRRGRTLFCLPASLMLGKKRKKKTETDSCWCARVPNFLHEAARTRVTLNASSAVHKTKRRAT